MDSLTQVLKAYGDAWCEVDAEKRRALLEIAWADDGLYQDPGSEARGRDSLHALIGRVLARFPGGHPPRPGSGTRDPTPAGSSAPPRTP